MSFGENVKQFRRDKGLTQGELSDLCGIKTGHISKIENDKAEPSLSTVYKLLKALECSPNALLLSTEEHGMSAAMATVLERAEKLDENRKRSLVDVIDHFCIAEGMIKAFEKDAGFLNNFFSNSGAIKPVIPDDAFK
ncbi:MAG: helix-turn-helix transcriptional regulator [Gammaproteobacteria bacterium]|nr:helix-turn-helix transcriptional regulator [Gammaproteobacteria bacterium]